MAHWAVILLTAAAALLSGCRKREGQAEQTLIIFHAGSLSIPVQELAELFEASYPGVEVRAESAGSRHCARKVADLGKPCDVMMSADTRVVESLLMPDHARFNIQFATNQMAIAYAPDSKFADDITAENWPEILQRDGVVLGRSEPESDPCGYRTLLVFQLAEGAFESPGLAERLARATSVIRPKETDLLSLLDLGEVDYLFIYRSVARQHGLRMVQLPDEINLRSAELVDLYATATVQLTGKRPGETITRKGEPMVYSLTIPTDAPHPTMAEAWVALLLSDAGRAIMERNDQPFLTPPTADGHDALPSGLKPLCKPRRTERSDP
jgi:molybdate/tungstate transport system substrate-binding protein